MRLSLMILATLLVSPVFLSAQGSSLADLLQRVEALEQQRAVRTAKDSWLTIYGFLRVDTVYDDSELNDNQVPNFVLSEAGVDHDDDFTMYTRLTRIGGNFQGPEVEGARITGKLEVDFYGSGASDSRNIMRLRHGYLKVEKGPWLFLAGQTFDLISPLNPSANPDTLFWNTGNPGDRRPQLRLQHTSDLGSDGSLFLQAALAQQGAIDGQNSDAPDGVLDGEDSGLPQIQARVGVALPVGDTRVEAGVWGARGWEESDLPAGDDEHNVVLYGIDVKVPFGERYCVKGELWQGSNGDDLRFGSAQGVNAATGDEIDAYGGWLQFDMDFPECGTLFTGYAFDDPSRHDVPGTGITHNDAFYAGYKLTRYDPVEVGFEYVYRETHYRALSDGEANRFRLYFSYKF